MKSIFAILIFSIITLFSYSQKILNLAGDTDFLKGKSNIQVVFIYPEDMRVGKISEQEYIKGKMEKAEAGKSGDGQIWLQNWENDRKKIYDPEFIKGFNKVMVNNRVDFELVESNDTEYTMLVKTVFIEPGYNVGVDRRNSKVSIEVSFAKTNAIDNVLAKFAINNSPGISSFGTDFEAGERIGEAYTKAGKAFAKYLVKANSF